MGPKNKRYDELIEIFLEAGKPMQAVEIALRAEQKPLLPKSYNGLRTMLSAFVKDKKLYMYKVPHMVSFYVLPGWINANTNQLKLNFDPYTKTIIDEPKNNAV